MNKIKLRIKELYLFGLYLIAGLTVLPFRKKQIWLLSERGREARDNAYWFFLYLKQKHPEIDSKYIISRKSVDRARLLDYNNDLIDYGSFNHYRYLWLASHFVSTHIMGYTTNMMFFNSIDKKFNLFGKKKKIFLQHGITKNKLRDLFSDKVNLDLYCCGAKLEYDYICSNFGFKNGVVQYTGLCRYDNLNKCTCKRQILIMPTWRKYINRNKFEESDYFIAWSSLLLNSTFVGHLEKYNYNVVFYPHYELHTLIHKFRNLNVNARITIAGFEYDVQELLKESDFLITDYSSVFFDMLYMHKPVLFYQFDSELFYSKHYMRGYLSENFLGDVAKNLDDVISYVEKILENKCQLQEDKEKIISELFPQRDSMNCERVFESIVAL